MGYQETSCSFTISDEVNQVPLDTLGKKTKKFRVCRASPLDVNEEISLGLGQVASFVRKGTKNDLRGSLLSGEHIESNPKVGSDMFTRTVSIKELSQLKEDVSSLQSVFLVKLEWGKRSGLRSLFKSRMFDNLSA